MAYFPIFIEIEKKKCVIIGGGKVALRKVETLLRYGAKVQVVSKEICEELRALLPPENLREIELRLPPENFREIELRLPPENFREIELRMPPENSRQEKLASPQEYLCQEKTESFPAEPDALSEPDFGRSMEAYLSDAALVIAATGSREINHRVAEYCRERRIPVNVADAPGECTFFFPAVVKKGYISIGINTGGKSPAVSSQVRRDVEAAIPGHYAMIAEQLGSLREYVKSRIKEEPLRRKILKQAAAEAFSHERILSQDEINTIIRQVLNHGTISGRPVGH